MSVCKSEERKNSLTPVFLGGKKPHKIEKNFGRVGHSPNKAKQIAITHVIVMKIVQLIEGSTLLKENFVFLCCRNHT